MENYHGSPEGTKNFSKNEYSPDEHISQDLSFIAGAIVTNANHIPRSLFCPFCAEEYMFEFTLKDHLKRKHFDELSKISLLDNLENIQECKSYICPYCRAVFYYLGLLPKHLVKFHGCNVFNHWIQSNRDSQESEKYNEPSILYAACSPGLTQIFENLATKENIFSENETNKSSELKSILKKTPSKTTSSIATSIRRHKGGVVKRSLSVRRELRFDIPPNQTTPEEKAVKKSDRFYNIKKFMRIRNIFSRKNTKASLSSNIVTSTPNTFLEDDDKYFGKKSRVVSSPRPLFFNSERYKCAHCMQMYSSNTDLVSHSKENHKSGKKFICPGYQCGQCGRKFFRNSHLVRHCQTVHTP